MNDKLLREAMEIGLACARSYAADYHLKYRGHYPKIHAEVDEDVRKIEAAIASLDAPAPTAPSFNQAEFDAMVEKGTKAWAVSDRLEPYPCCQGPAVYQELLSQRTAYIMCADLCVMTPMLSLGGEDPRPALTAKWNRRTQRTEEF